MPDQKETLHLYWMFKMPDDEDPLNISKHSVLMYDDREEFVKYDEAPRDAEFDDDQLLLCPSAIQCYSLVYKSWYKCSVDKLQHVQWNKTAYDHLVLDKQLKRMVTNVLENHQKKIHKDVGDVINGKGNVSNIDPYKSNISYLRPRRA